MAPSQRSPQTSPSPLTKHTSQLSKPAIKPPNLLEESWILTDDLFDRDVTPNNSFSIPISLRMPYIFYLGHLPSFASNTLLSQLTPPCPTPNSQLDYLFSRGIDPDVEDPAKCHSHPDAPSVWPAWNVIVDYRDRVRDKIRENHSKLPGRRLGLVAEHEAMHIETLRYMLAQDRRTRDISDCCTVTEEGGILEQEPDTQSELEWCEVPTGKTSTGCVEGVHVNAWDNELDDTLYTVPSFRISRTAISVREMVDFVLSGGYSDASLWTNDWTWLKSNNIKHPASWECHPKHKFIILTTPTCEPWYKVSDLPASVNLAEARAYARWLSRKQGINLRLPSELEWNRAAYGCVDGMKIDQNGHVHEMKNGPVSVKNVDLVGMSWCGVIGMVDNGWELTTSLFERFEGFQEMIEYPEYSADFFDGKHFVLKGASWATHPMFVRKTFRNFYQAKYSYVFTKFRLVHES